jgi:hypothetical protein
MQLTGVLCQRTPTGERCNMRHLLKCETMSVCVICFLVYSLAFAPVFLDLHAAQSQSSTSPVISHQPVKVGWRGRPLNIVAHIADDTGIQTVTITINYGGKSTSGRMPVKKGSGDVPVVAVVPSNIDVYQRADFSSKRKGIIRGGERVQVTRVNGGFYRILTTGGLSGYVDANDVQPSLYGRVYGVALPASMTELGSLTYQISATDVDGHVAKTDLVSVRTVTREEVAALRAGGTGQAVSAAERAAPTAEEEKKSGSGKILPWIVLAAIGGGAVYFLTQQKEKDDTEVVDVVVGWE